MTTFYKAVRPNGRDFFTDSVDYGAALISGEVLRHSSQHKRYDDASSYFSVSVEPAEALYGGAWPTRLLRVEPVGSVIGSSVIRHKRAVSALRVVEELPAWQALGPNGRQVAAVAERAASATIGEYDRMRMVATKSIQDRSQARNMARIAARLNARLGALVAVENEGWGAATAYVTRDLIIESHFQALAEPWLSVIGELAVE